MANLESFSSLRWLYLVALWCFADQEKYQIFHFLMDFSTGHVGQAENLPLPSHQLISR